MTFNSLSFMVFFVVMLGVHRLPLNWRIKKLNLLLASYLFYAAWNPPLLLLLLASTTVDWWVARQIHRQQADGPRKAWLLVSVIINLSFLGYFKYGKFMLDNVHTIYSWIGLAYTPPAWDILLPVGISFYTFHSLSYTFDIYWRRAQPIPNFFDFALFVAFFTQLVAGPILRKSDLVPQLERPRQASVQQFGWGMALMTLGLFEKVVMADGALAPAADAVFSNDDPVGAIDAWIGALAFSGQIFCDFAGYSTIAVGAALCFGFNIPSNFAYPYAAVGFSDFWRRWHISLSSWLRDYLYIPLGGNRGSEARTYRNLMATMLLGGLWHGANWTFVIWGGLHGAYLIIERQLKRLTENWGLPTGWPFRVFLALLTYTLVNLAWVFFRAQTVPSAFKMVAAMFGAYPSAVAVLPTIKIVETLICVSGLLIVHWQMRERPLESLVSATPRPFLVGVLACMAFAVTITQGTGGAFIYFQF